MVRPRVKMLSKGSRQVLRSPEVRSETQRRLDAVAQAAGPGFEVEVTVGDERILGAVRPATYDAARREARDRVLTRALDAAR